MWTKEALQDLIESKLSGHRFIVVANREPYLHRYAGNRIECVPPVSGMVSALDPILKACGGVWVAHGSGSADRKMVDSADHVQVPPEDPLYTLRRVWLTKEQEQGYYSGLSNGGLWPLCHMAFTRPIFDPQQWAIYREVNERFAGAVLEEADDEPAFVFIQDFHFALLPRMLKEKNPNLVIAHFWHIPWPAPEVFQTFPWKEELLEGLLGNDLLAFQLRYHCQNFLDTVDHTIEAKADYENFEVTRRGKTTVVRPFPISIDFAGHAAMASSAPVDNEIERWRQKLHLNGATIGIGIDRIDYTKGLIERFRALDRFLEKNPGHAEHLVFVQIGVPSRVNVRQYKLLDDEIDHLVEEINWKWSTDSWQPIIYLKEQHSPLQMMALHRLADFCMVTSLDDGMNLVAKEFPASRIDGDGVLILSRFTGAARELSSALLVNPFSVDEIADAIQQAVEMPEDERSKRMEKMRAMIEQNNVFRWAGKLLSALIKLEFPETSRPEPEFAGHAF
jgi:trehalose 6-phosphate synthase